jgi:YidC/Oxa1 family membrane protein insertase
MEERRLLNAFLLTIVILVAYYSLFPPGPGRPAEVPSPRPIPSASATPAAESRAPESEPSVAPGTPALERVVADGEHRVEVVTPEIAVAFKNRGARLISWKINNFRDEAGSPEEMVKTTQDGALPFDLDTGDPDVDARLRDGLFRSSTEVLQLRAAETGTLVFEFAEGDIAARKEFHFSGSGYVVRVAVSVRRGGREIAKKVLWGPGIGHPSVAERAVQGYQDPNGVVLLDSGFTTLEPQKIEGAVSYNSLRWIGVAGRHFTAIWIPPGDKGAGELKQVQLPAENGDSKPVPAALAAVALGPSSEPAQLYVGPKDYYRLAGLGHDLVAVVDLGMFGRIVVLMMGLLRWLHSQIGNYGWSIVALTVMISLVMAPLRHYGIVNGRKMAKIAPEMKVIQDRYRKMTALDPRRQEMHQEMGALYARHGMSMGTQMALGCLPILITMPFLYAVYQVLNVSIDLRGADFLWVPDLSHRDPYFIMPILMAGSMFLTQKLTPTTMDPAQQRMMMIMPIILLTFCVAAPAGLNLYWFVSNVCSIVQQLATLRVLGSREAAPAIAKGRRK